MPDTLDEQLTKYLTDVHSIEEQALRQLRTATKIAGDPELARTFGDHLIETEGQGRRVRERLEARGADPSKTKDLLGASRRNRNAPLCALPAGHSRKAHRPRLLVRAHGDRGIRPAGDRGRSCRRPGDRWRDDSA
jgi:hypothetical protein